MIGKESLQLVKRSVQPSAFWHPAPGACAGQKTGPQRVSAELSSVIFITRKQAGGECSCLVPPTLPRLDLPPVNQGFAGAPFAPSNRFFSSA
jgi:hypothetical protein